MGLIYPYSMRRTLAGIAASLMFLSVVSACSSDPLALPDVEGQPLDEAYNILQDAGFEQISHADAIRDRAVWSRGNWTVLEQEPGGGAYLDEDTEILLQVAKMDDSGLTRDHLPEDSPLLAQIIEREEQEAQQQREQAAEQRQAVQEFVDDIDPPARVAQEMFSDLGDLRNRVEAVGGLTFADGARLRDMELPTTVYEAAFEEPPSSIANDATKLQNAVQQFGRAVSTLKSARGAAVPGAIERFDQLYNPAVEEYNDALADIYAPTSVSAPTVQLR